MSSDPWVPFLTKCMLSCSVVSHSLWPTVCSPPGSSVPGILHARILEWVAMPSSKGCSQPRDQTHISCGSCIGRCVLYHRATWEELPRGWLKPCVPGQARLLMGSTEGGQMASLLFCRGILICQILFVSILWACSDLLRRLLYPVCGCWPPRIQEDWRGNTWERFQKWNPQDLFFPEVTNFLLACFLVSMYLPQILPQISNKT